MHPIRPSRFLALAVAISIPLAALAQHANAPWSDAKFVTAASASGLAEVRLGQLGASKGSSSAIRDFGQQMVVDHGKANDELKAIASRKNLALSTMPGPDDEKAATRIGAMSGGAFDAAFRQKMVADHEKAVKLFTMESTGGKDPDLKAFATKTLPTLKEHLDMAKGLPVGGATSKGSLTSR